MKLKGQRSYASLSSLMDGAAELNSDLVERGTIFKKFLFKDEKNYIAILFVGPQSKIKLHKHQTDNEEYKDLDTQDVEKCKMGDWHYLENESEDKWLVVQAHKYI